MTREKSTKQVCNMKICEMQSVCRGFLYYFTEQISRVLFLCCFVVEAVTLRNTKGILCEEVDEITYTRK